MEEEGTAVLPWVRTSERSSFKRCPQQWYWGYVEKIEPITTVVGAREFGTGIHLCMERFYQPGLLRGTPLLETWEEWCAEQDKASVSVFDEEGEKQWVELKELGRTMLTEYMRVTKGDPMWNVIAAELHFQIEVNGKAINVGTIDLVIRDENGDIWIVDHKTCARFPNFDWLDLDDQNGTYSAVATQILRDQELIGPNEKVRGFLYNFLRKGVPDERPIDDKGRARNKPVKKHYIEACLQHDQITEDHPAYEGVVKAWTKLSLAELAEEAKERGVTVLGEVSKTQPTPLIYRHELPRTVKEKNRQLQHIQDDVLVMDMARNGQIPILKVPTKDCPSFCDYFTLCRIDESKGDVDTFKKRMFKSKDPYADHREGAESSKVFVGKGA